VDDGRGRRAGGTPWSRAGVILFVSALLAGVVSTSAVRADPVTDAKARVDAAAKALDPHAELIWLDATPDAPALLSAYFDSLHDWVIAVLRRHPGATPSDLVAAAATFGEGFRLTAIPLGADALAISASEGERGDVFVVRRGPDGPTLVWSLTAWASSRKPPDPLAGWNPERARDDCRSSGPWDAWKSCGPLYASLGRLPSDRRGRPRFYVDADYAQPAGADIGGQISVWRWDGRTAAPQYVDAYGLTIEQEAGVRLHGDRLLVREKGEFRTFFAAASSQGRQIDHVLRITPDGVVDQGRVSRRPDLDLIDQVIDRILDGKPAGAQAAPAAAAVLRRELADERAERRKTPREHWNLGMMEGWTVRRVSDGRRLCLAADNGALEFTLRGEGREATIAAVRPLPGDCGKGARD
jgi:hypothetical protein